MTQINSLYDYADDNQILVLHKDIPFESIKGLYFDNTIILDSGIETTAELKTVFAEEIGHYESSHGNILNLSSLASAKQEVKARRLAHDMLITLVDLVDAFNASCKSKYEIAEYLEVTEVFLSEAIDSFRERFGLFTVTSDYVIYFEPLAIMKMYNEHNFE